MLPETVRLPVPEMLPLKVRLPVVVSVSAQVTRVERDPALKLVVVLELMVATPLLPEATVMGLGQLPRKLPPRVVVAKPPCHRG